MKREKPPSCLPQLTVLLNLAAAVALPAAPNELVDEAYAQACEYSLDTLQTLARRLCEEKQREQRQAVADATAEAERVAAESARTQERAHTVACDELKKAHATELADVKEAARAQEAKLATELADVTEDAAKAAANASVERENAFSQLRDQVSRLGISAKQAQAEQANAEQAKAEADEAHAGAKAGAAVALAKAEADAAALRGQLDAIRNLGVQDAARALTERGEASSPLLAAWSADPLALAPLRLAGRREPEPERGASAAAAAAAVTPQNFASKSAQELREFLTRYGGRFARGANECDRGGLLARVLLYADDRDDSKLCVAVVKTMLLTKARFGNFSPKAKAHLLAQIEANAIVHAALVPSEAQS